MPQYLLCYKPMVWSVRLNEEKNETEHSSEETDTETCEAGGSHTVIQNSGRVNASVTIAAS